jgi:hypothetical protein
MGTRGRWKAWLAGAAVILVAFGLAWWNNPANVGFEREVQRAGLALGYSAIGLAVFVFPLAMRTDGEVAAQRTLIIFLALFIAVCVWWVGYLPSDPFGCSRVDAPDCHTNAVTRWRALAEGLSVYLLTFLLTHVIGKTVERRRARQAAAVPGR